MLHNIALDSVSKRILEKAPVEETLSEILNLIMAEPGHALARIWLVKPGDICSNCPMRGECPNRTQCLHLTASIGRDNQGKLTWRGLEGRFRRFPLGIRKIGFAAETGESVRIDDLDQSEHSWIVDREWIRNEGIKGVAAHPLRIQDDVFGVISVFSRENFNDESFRWLRLFADQASIAIANARAFEEIGRLREKLREENEYLREEIQEASQHTFLIGESPAWKMILQQIDLVAGSDATVLVTGESGTGKELVARAIHESSPRRENALVRVNCAAISPELFESEFFGHTKGSFTGAVRDRPGRFQLADGGTIFLDEIGELPLNMQGKLLRVIQERQFERVGEDRTNTINVRIVAATNRDLAAEVRNGNFREDLFYRLNVFPISVPPLRERPEDIEPLTHYFVNRFAKKMRCRSLEVTHADIELLKSYTFPGNVRELENIVERAMILAQCDQLNISLPKVLDRMIVHREEIRQPVERVLTIDDLKQLERENIVRALKRSNYRIYGADGAASLIGSKPTTLISRIKRLGIAMRPSA